MIDVTIKLGKDDRDKLQSLSDRRAVTMKDFLHGMIAYFEETDMDPLTKEKRVPDEIARMRKEILDALKETRNTTVAFIREQEKNKLLPLIGRVNEITETLFNFLKEDALRKSDLEWVFQKNQVPAAQQIIPHVLKDKEATKELEINRLDYERLLKRARDLFVDFLKKGKRSTFGGGLVFENETVDFYRIEFTKLKF